MTSSSPANSPCLCNLWTKRRQRHQAGAPDTLAGRQLLGPTCQTAVAALFNGAGEREVKKLNLLRSPVFWCLGDGPTMHEPGALPKTPGRRVTALPMTDHLVTRPGADAQPQRLRSQVLVLACRRVCWALSGRHRAGGRTRRCVLKITRWELAKVMGFITVFAVWRLGPWRGGLGPPMRVRVWAATSGMVASRVMGGDRVGGPWGGAYALL